MNTFQMRLSKQDEKMEVMQYLMESIEDDPQVA